MQSQDEAGESCNEKNDQSGEINAQQTDKNLKELLNVSFIESLDDIAKFSYASLCATVLQFLYNSSDEKEFRHTFVTSLVAHLCLPINVAHTMEALSDGHGQTSTEIFVDNIMQNKFIQNDPLLLVNDMVMWALTSSHGRYDARTRYIIRHVSWKMRIKYEDLENVEELLIEMLRQSTEKEKAEQEVIRSKKARSRKWKRYALIGLATAGGGALIGLTGGLAAPLVAAGAGAILGGASAAALGSVAGLAIITSLFGAAGAGLTGYKMKRRVGGIDEFLFKPLTVSTQPSICIAISGWLSDDCDNAFLVPWQNMLISKEQYSLIWESKHLMRLGNAFEYILNSLVSVAATEALKYTVLAGLITAVAWPATLISVAGVIDNPWSVCLKRSVQVGRQLAEVLLAREHGHRPVTLIGYSLGARVIFHCLEEMSKRNNHQGVVEDVYLLGAPVSGKPEDWKQFSSVVAGHITNAYSRTDWLLKFLYRTSSAQVKVAGLQPVEWEDRRMINIDLSSVIEGHLDYAKNMDTVLSAIGVRSKSSHTVMEKVKKSSSCPVLADSTHIFAASSSKSHDLLGRTDSNTRITKEEQKIHPCDSHSSIKEAKPKEIESLKIVKDQEVVTNDSHSAVEEDVLRLQENEFLQKPEEIESLKTVKDQEVVSNDSYSAIVEDALCTQENEPLQKPKEIESLKTVKYQEVVSNDSHSAVEEDALCTQENEPLQKPKEIESLKTVKYQEVVSNDSHSAVEEDALCTQENEPLQKPKEMESLNTVKYQEVVSNDSHSAIEEDALCSQENKLLENPKESESLKIGSYRSGS